MLFFSRFFQDAGCVYASMEWTVDTPANRKGVFRDGCPSIVLETPKPDL